MIFTRLIYRRIILTSETWKAFRILVCLASMVFFLPVTAQISPGKLSEVHAHLEGLSNCTKCHDLGEKVSDKKCLVCHDEINTRIELKKGYHASPEVRTKSCTKCHSDHHGREFEMIHFDNGTFDHSLTGYNLQGSHKILKCRDCHRSELILDSELRSKSTTYLGLGTTCLSCHPDYHQGTLSSECLTCHDHDVFVPASKFDHRTTRFALRGKHLKVDCSKCHNISVNKGVKMQEFAGVPFDNCTRCHQDVHRNKFGQNCTQCHSEESFFAIKQSGNFNHSRTDYPLTGRHQVVACAGCHKTRYTSAIRYDRCSNCHSDYHNKQFEKVDGTPDCSECHTTFGFEQSTYSLERHNMAGFKLKGAHLATPCLACHKKTDRWSFRNIGLRCIDCHKDVHESFLDQKFYPGKSCESCHDSHRWGDIDFDHSRTSYILEGAHIGPSCRSCHFKTDNQGNVIQEFSQVSPRCLNCHKDRHQGQFEETEEAFCLKCHDYSDWSLKTFDHDQTAFRLDGKHRNVACNKCHLPAVSGDIIYIQYKLKNFSCESCH